MEILEGHVAGKHQISWYKTVAFLQSPSYGPSCGVDELLSYRAKIGTPTRPGNLEPFQWEIIENHRKSSGRGRISGLDLGPSLGAACLLSQLSNGV